MFRAVVEQLDGYGSAADMVRATFDTFFDSLDAERNASLVQHAEQHRSDSAVTDLVLAGRRRLDARVADALATWNSADRVTLEATPLGDRPSIRRGTGRGCPPAVVGCISGDAKSRSGTSALGDDGAESPRPPLPL